jgi:hypothetical protein
MTWHHAYLSEHSGWNKVDRTIDVNPRRNRRFHPKCGRIRPVMVRERAPWIGVSVPSLSSDLRRKRSRFVKLT